MKARVIAVAVALSLGSGALVATPAFAQSDEAAEIAQLKQQLAVLQAKVNELEQRSHAKSSSNVGTQQNPAAVQQQAKPVQPGPDAWADSTRVGGTAFIDFTDLDQTKNGTRTDASGTGLDVKRFYLTVDHAFTDVWSANLTTDFNYSSVDGETQLFVKKAYLQGKFSPLATLRVGSANLAWIPFVEEWYGYRFVENTLVDRAKFGTSADWGVHLLGDSGMFNYQASIINGGGYRNPTRSNSVDFEGRIGFQPIKSVMIGVGGYSGDLGKDTHGTPALHDAHRYDAMIAYHGGGLRLGGEYFRATDWNNVLTPATDSANGWSLWSSYDFGPASIFARYDRVNPSRDLDPSLKDTYYNFGVAFPVTEGVRVALAYKNELLKDNSKTNTRSREFGAWGEVKF
ncbi:MAG TPA: carbohydrate porin [Rhodanobacteraceae bacterium]|nr:carbohydrate porin [Rhodanobacteraceae bacterium]